MAAPRSIITASGKTLPDHPDYDENVFRAVEAEWLVHAAQEQFCARWVMTTSIGGKTTVHLQKDDGRGHSRRANQTAETGGYHRLNALNGQPSILILTVQDMAEAVYRHYLARDPEEENTQKIFNRRFRAKYEGTREEDLNWIIQKIKLRTKEAAQGVLAPYIAPPSTFSRTTNTAPAHYAVQSGSNSRASVSQAAPATPQSRRTPPTSTTRHASTTPQYAFQQPNDPRVTANGFSQITPSQSQRSATAVTPVSSITGTPARTVPADDNRGSLSESKKRGTTLSMDFSERLPSRPRISESEPILSDYTPTPPARHASTALRSANRSASSTTPTPYKSSTTSSYSGMRGDSNGNKVLESRSTGTRPRIVSGPAAASSSARAGKDSTSGRTGSSNSSVNSVARNGHIIDLTDEGDEWSGISSLMIGTSNGPGTAAINTNKTLGGVNRTKADAGSGRRGQPTLHGGKQIRTELTGKSGDLSASITKGLNAQGSGSDGLKGSLANGSSKARKHDAFARSLTCSPTKVEKGPSKGSGVVMGGSPMKVNKRYEGGTAKLGDSSTTFVKATGNGGRSGLGAPGFTISKDGKTPSTPQEPHPSSTNGPNPGSSGFATPGGGPRNVCASGAPPGLDFRKRDTPNRRYENKPVDSTAHMYNAAPDPEKYSDEWQNRRLALGVSIGLTKDPDTSTPPVGKTQAAGSTGCVGGQSSSSASKPRPVEPAGLIGVLTTITNWPSGNLGSKTAANLSTPARNGMGGEMGSSHSLGMKTPTMDSGTGNSNALRSAASNNNATKAPPTGPSGYRTSSVDYRNSSVPVVGNSNGRKWDSPTKPTGSGSSVNNTAPTEARNSSGSSRNSSGKIGDTPPKGPAAWKNGAAPPTGPRGFRPRSPPFSDSYRPKYAESDGSRVYGRYDEATRPNHRSSSGGYDSRSGHHSSSVGYGSRSDQRADPRSGQQSPPYFDSRSRHGYGDRHYDSRYRH